MGSVAVDVHGDPLRTSGTLQRTFRVVARPRAIAGSQLHRCNQAGPVMPPGTSQLPQAARWCCAPGGALVPTTSRPRAASGSGSASRNPPLRDQGAGEAEPCLSRCGVAWRPSLARERGRGAHPNPAQRHLPSGPSSRRSPSPPNAVSNSFTLNPRVGTHSPTLPFGASKAIPNDGLLRWKLQRSDLDRPYSSHSSIGCPSASSTSKESSLAFRSTALNSVCPCPTPSSTTSIGWKWSERSFSYS